MAWGWKWSKYKFELTKPERRPYLFTFGRGRGVEMPGQACELQTCSEHITTTLSPYLGEATATSVLTHSECQTDNRRGTERAAQRRDVQPRELRRLTTTGPAVGFEWTAMGFPKFTSLASFWNSKLRRFRAWYFMDQSQPSKIQVRICSKHGDFRRKILASNSRKWPCHDPDSVCSTAKMPLHR